MRKINLIIASFLLASSLPAFAAFCSNCGNQLSVSDNFCSTCGQSIGSTNSSSSTTTYVTPNSNTVTYTTTTQNGVVTTTTTGNNTVIYTQPSVIVKPVPVPPPQPSPVVKLVDGLLSYQRWRHKAHAQHAPHKIAPAPGPRIGPLKPPAPPKGPNPKPAPTKPAPPKPEPPRH